MAYTFRYRFDWDPDKDAANQRKHGVGFQEASALFRADVEYVEFFDELHSELEERFLAIGPIRRGIVVVVFTEHDEGEIRLISARWATRREVWLFHEHMREP